MPSDRVFREGFKLAGMLTVLLAGTSGASGSVKKQYEAARKRYERATAERREAARATPRRLLE